MRNPGSLFPRISFHCIRATLASAIYPDNETRAYVREERLDRFTDSSRCNLIETVVVVDNFHIRRNALRLLTPYLVRLTRVNKLTLLSLICEFVGSGKEYRELKRYQCTRR